MGDTKIQWTGKTWNPIRARNTATSEVGWFCEHVSHGCDNCYAEKMNVNTYFGNGLEYKTSNLPRLELFLDEKILEQPLRWRKPTMIFPCSMTDLFGRFVPDAWIIAMFKVMAQASRHTFQVLTKRPERMRDMSHNIPGLLDWPNVWLGTSVEDQDTANTRIPALLDTDAMVRWVSAEPLLEAIDLDMPPARFNERELNWVVVGGESGKKARPFNVEWARSVVQQCKAAGVPVFVKQLGGLPVDSIGHSLQWPNFPRIRASMNAAEGVVPLRDKKGGNINEWPEDLRVREFPSNGNEAG